MALERASHNLRKGAARDALRRAVSKLRAYCKLPSVQHDLIVWPDEQRIVHHARKPDG